MLWLVICLLVIKIFFLLINIIKRCLNKGCCNIGGYYWGDLFLLVLLFFKLFFLKILKSSVAVILEK